MSSSSSSPGVPNNNRSTSSSSMMAAETAAIGSVGGGGGGSSSSGQLRQRKTTTSTTHQQTATTTTGNNKMVQDDELTIIESVSGSTTIPPSHESLSSRSSQCYYNLTPLIQVHPLLRLDVGPFIIAYSFLICMDYYYIQNDDVDDHNVQTSRNDINDNSHDNNMDLKLVMTLLFVLTMLTHLSMVLSTQWNVVMKVVVGYRQCSSSTSTLQTVWTHCYVQTTQSIVQGGGGGEAPGIVPVTYSKSSSSGVVVAIVKFHDLIFRCSQQQQQPDDDVRLWISSSSTATTTTTTTTIATAVSKRFLPLYYPIDLSLSFYATYKGHASLQDVRMAECVYGPNTTTLQLPTLVDLLSHQVVAPFFLFQVFCVVLWSLDEYWYYAMFTLVALLIFESTVAYNRLMGLQRLHRAGQGGQQQQRVWVRRGGCISNISTSRSSSSNSGNSNFAWFQISTSELVPGDYICLQNNTSGMTTVVPADILLLSGTAVCDEALLTGESIPQLKQALDLSSLSCSSSSSTTTSDTAVAEEPRLDLQDNLVKESILFGGTNLLVASSSSEDGEEEEEFVTKSSSSSGVPHAPPGICNNSNDNNNEQGGGGGGGAVMGMVLRTGFETAQGSLLRTMAHSSAQADGIHTMDTFVFIFILVACAIFAASLVLRAGWQDDKRNTFRLILHVIMIITSVVPPELPMELSLAVTQSVAALMHKCRVYCTEHFRIPWAGEVKVCCFDKTGTLTSDEMRLRGIRLFHNNNYNGKKDKANNLKDADDNDDDDQLVMPDNDESNGGRYNIPWETMRIMVSCHALALAGGHVSKKRSGGGKRGEHQQMTVGNPLEQAVLLKTGYQLAGNNLVVMSTNDDHDIDDMEQAAAVAKKQGYAKQIKILHRFAFSSKLKRMTVLATETTDTPNIIWALTKGAPETIKELLAKDSIPDNYDQVSFHHMSLGRRVLAMAYRKIEAPSKGKNTGSNKSAGWDRQGIEQGLIFAGFFVLDCPVKPDSKSVITELRKSGHDNVMITGDAILTACEVARQVGIVPRRPAKSTFNKKQRCSTTTLMYRIQPRNCSSFGPTSRKDVLSNFECVLLSAKSENSKTLPLSHSNISDLMAMKTSGNAAFCISGDCLVQIALAAIGNKNALSSRVSTNEEKSILLNPIAQAVLTQLVPLISVFARHAPHQKEAVVAAFNHGGNRTLMVGDGTNDVGALKRAHVGISIISAPQVEAKQRQATAKISKIKTEQQQAAGSGGGKQKKRMGKPSKKHTKSLEESLQQLREAQDDLDHVELGDASVAAPFLSRTVSIKCVKEVIQQGRCTLVTILQIYKILGINCLVNAMVLSKLFLHGVKQGDRQLTFLGIAVAGLFYFVTRAEPLSTLSPCRPPASVLCMQALLSITLQFGIHFAAILLATEVALAFVDPYDPSLVPDGPFNPNVLNSCTFLLTCVATINTFAVNYRGRPFMCDLHENKFLYRSLLVCYAVLTICCLEIFPPLNDLLQLTTLPSAMSSSNNGLTFLDDVVFNTSGQHALILSLVKTIDFPVFMFGLMALDTILAFAAERLVLHFFP